MKKSYSEEFIQTNSPDGGFLQSNEWQKFQESVGRKTFTISENNFHANIIEHVLPMVGKYLYIPRGPIICHPERSEGSLDSSRSLSALGGLGMTETINLAKRENISWIRFDANDQEILEIISKAKLFQNQSSALKIRKAPHDMQPREIFLIDISKSEEQLLAEMKPKTRYNIKVAQKHGIKIITCHPERSVAESKDLIGVDSSRSLSAFGGLGMTDRYLKDFLRLIKITTKRDKITLHPDEYYRKMFKTIPAENIKLYVAEYDGKIIAANINIFFGKTATYLHGASDHNYRNYMAPYLLQWQAMLDAKAAGCDKYDLGGISTNYELNTNIRITNSWAGITRFKAGFSTTTEPLKFPGSYDIVINPFKYNLYKILQRIKALF